MVLAGWPLRAGAARQARPIVSKPANLEWCAWHAPGPAQLAAMTRSTSTLFSVIFVVVFGLSSMFLYFKIMSHGTQLGEFVSVQEAARQSLAKQLREEAAHHQGKHEGAVSALEEKVRLLGEAVEAMKAEAKAAVSKEAQQTESLAALERELGKVQQLTTDQAAQIYKLEATAEQVGAVW